MCASVGCKPKSVGLKADDDISKLRASSSNSSAGNASLDSVVSRKESAPPMTPLLASACVRSVPVLHEEFDVLSLRFTPVSGPNVSVTDAHPTLLSYPLPPHATGGTLNVRLTLNSVSKARTLTHAGRCRDVFIPSYVSRTQTYASVGNGSGVVACFSPWAPVLKLNQAGPCHTGTEQETHSNSHFHRSFTNSSVTKV